MRPYRGEIEVRIWRGDLLVVERADLEDYVTSVLSQEMCSNWPQAAQEAQAVVARSFALASRGRHAPEGFDLCDTTHCQIYRGASEKRSAARRTAGWVLMRYGRPLEALYHSTCGGVTANSRQVWPENPRGPELFSVRDGSPLSPLCRDSPHFRWICRLTRANLEEALARHPKTDPGGKLRAIRIAQRDIAGRVLWIQIEGSCLRQVPGVDFWKAIGDRWGWGRVRSTRFELSRSGEVYTFRGRGLGHGVGLCQWGARGLALQGYGFQAILRHYFPNSRLYRVESPG